MQTSFDELITFANVLTNWSGTGSEQVRQALSSVVVTRARIADLYRDTTGINHPIYGNGSLKDSCESLICHYHVGLDNDVDREKRFHRALATACLAVNGDFVDPTSGATHFHHHLDNPAWSTRHDPKALIGDYLFYGIEDAAQLGGS